MYMLVYYIVKVQLSHRYIQRQLVQKIAGLTFHNMLLYLYTVYFYTFLLGKKGYWFAVCNIRCCIFIVSIVYMFMSYFCNTDVMKIATVLQQQLCFKDETLTTTVNFIYVCQRLFGDNFFITCFFELKFSWCVSTFFI